MIIKSAQNRKVILEYLEEITEATLISEIIIPLFIQTGYSTLRINTHGPGEHGKDLVFYRHIPAFFDNEYVVVQAKAEKVTTDNITEKTNQLIRALRTPIVGLSGGMTVFPNYVVFFNSKRISNDAHWEFPYLIDGKNNIKIISQENMCDLILQYAVIPDSILPSISVVNSTSDDQINKDILNILYRNISSEIDNLFGNLIPIYKKDLNDNVKRVIIEYIFNTWRQDKSWEGTVKPMKWLNMCFDFLHEDQYVYLLEVISEFTSSTPSFQAQNDTLSIVRKITKVQLLVMQSRFVEFVAEISPSKQTLPILLEKLKILHDNTNDNKLKKMSEKILLFHDLYKKSNLTTAESAKRRKLYDEINGYVVRNLRRGNPE
jgi:hypothetical protein